MRLCENRLGWIPNQYMASTRARALMVDKLQAAAGADPIKVTVANLKLAVEYLYRRRQSISSPAYLPRHIDAALGMAAEVDAPTDLDTAIREAIDHERALERPGFQEWVGRLVRASGSFRVDVLQEWRSEHRDH